VVRGGCALELGSTGWRVFEVVLCSVGGQTLRVRHCVYLHFLVGLRMRSGCVKCCSKEVGCVICAL